MSFAGKVAIVTGATSGIGRATAICLADRGAVVVGTGRRRSEGEAVVAEIARTGGKARLMTGDVTERGFAGRLVEDVLGREGRLDILVNNAGILFRGTAEECTDEQWDRTLATNVTGVFLMSRAAVPAMRRSGGGAIVNVASDWALVAASRALAYGVSKGAVAQLTRSMAVDHAADRIRVNAVCPGDTDTPMLDSGMKGGSRAEHLARLGSSVPLGRVARPEEVAAAIAYLASEEAAYMTGVLLPIDGGNTAR